MVLFSPLAHAFFFLYDARGAFHTKQCFIQTRTTGTSAIECTAPHLYNTQSGVPPREERSREVEVVVVPVNDDVLVAERECELVGL